MIKGTHHNEAEGRSSLKSALRSIIGDLEMEVDSFTDLASTKSKIWSAHPRAFRTMSSYLWTASVNYHILNVVPVLPLTRAHVTRRIVMF